MQAIKTYSKRCRIMNTKRFTGNFHRNDFITLLNGFLIIRASKNGLLKGKSQIYGVLGKVRIVSILFVYNTNVRLCISWVWQNNDSVSLTNHFSIL